MKGIRVPLIILLILLFVAIFLFGSILEPYTGEGIYYVSIPSKDGTERADSIIRFEEQEGTRKTFSMFNFMYTDLSEGALPDSITKTKLEYSGDYYKHVAANLYLRPTGLHFPVFNYEKGTRVAMNWTVADLVSLTPGGDRLEQAFSNISHTSQIILGDDFFRFDNVTYSRLDPVPEQVQQWMDMLDAAMGSK